MPALYIDISARFAQLQDALANVDKSFSGLGQKIQKELSGALKGIPAIGAWLASALAGITAGISFAALKEKFDSIIESTAELGHVAEKTGASVENLSALKAIATSSGQEFGIVETALIRMSKAMTVADSQSQNAGAALEALWLKAKDLRSMDSAVALQTFAERLNEFRDSSSKTAIAIDVLGRSGAQALPFLKELGEAGKLVGKTTSEQAEQAKEYEKALHKLSIMHQAIYKQIALDILPSALDLVKAYKSMREESRMTADDKSIKTWAEQGADAIAILVDAVQGLVRAWQLMTTVAGAMFATLENSGKVFDLSKGFGLLKEENRKQISDILSIQKSVKEDASKQVVDILSAPNFSDRLREQRLKSTIVEAGRPPRDLDYKGKGKTESSGGTQVSDGQRLIENLTERLQKEDKLNESQTLETNLARGKYAVISAGEIAAARSLAMRIDASNEAQSVEKQRLDLSHQYLESLRSHFAPMEEELQKLKEQNEFYGLTQAQISAITEARLDEALATATLNGADEEHINFLRRELDLRSQITEQAGALDLKKMASQTGEVDKVANQLAMTFSSAFEDAVVGGKKFREVLAGIAQDIARLALRKAVVEPTGNALASLFSGAGSWLTGILPKFASGTDYVPRDMLAIVHQGEAIIPSGQNRGGDTTVNVSVSTSGARSSGGAGNAADLGRVIGNLVQAELVRQQRPGGLLAA